MTRRDLHRGNAMRRLENYFSAEKAYIAETAEFAPLREVRTETSSVMFRHALQKKHSSIIRIYEAINRFLRQMSVY